VITLYDYTLSGNCYKVRLLLSLLGVPFSARAMDLHPAREQKSDWFLTLNPLGQLPVIDDDGLVLRESQAILVYLASRYDESGHWYPRHDAACLGRISQWLGFAEGLTATAGAARRHDTLLVDLDIVKCRAGAHALLRILDEHLWFAEQEGQKWLCSAEHPTIADLACFPYVMLCEEGGVSRLPYPAIRRWGERVKHLPGFTPMSGIFPASGP
jgi:glutathione S-transferase